MFKIGEFSKITQVSIRMLRYYDEQKLLIPNVIDPLNGYRMYSANQIERLNRIILLRDLGFNVREIKTMLQEWNADKIRVDLNRQLEKIQENIKREQAKLRQIQGYLADLENHNTKLDIQIIMKQIPSQQVISLRRTMPNYYYEGELWKELSQRIEGIKGIETNRSFSIYHDLDYREQDVDIEVCVGINEASFDYEHFKLDSDFIYRQVEDVDIAATFMIYGPYSNISIAYKEFAYWLEKHSEYEMAGENRQVCHISMCHTSNPDEYITELQIPLKYVK